MDKLKAIKAKLEAAKKELQDIGREAIEEAFKGAFAANPTLQAVKWTQYTPYFNDGDACVFGVSDHYLKMDGDEEDEDGEWPYRYASDKELPAIEKQAVTAVDAIFREAPEEAMLAAFGDHSQIIATRAGFDVEEYEHD